VSSRIDLRNLEWGETVIDRSGEPPLGQRRTMRRHGKVRRASIALNFTAMIDVVFLLLLYFMLTADFARQEDAFALDLPGQGQSEQADDPFALPEQPVIVSVRSSGDRPTEYELQTDSPLVGEVSTYESLTDALTPLAGDLLALDHEIVIVSEADTRWEHTLGAYNAVTRSGFEKVRFARPASNANPTVE
jgi:biopolymer transport protein ExbD